MSSTPAVASGELEIPQRVGATVMIFIVSLFGTSFPIFWFPSGLEVHPRGVQLCHFPTSLPTPPNFQYHTYCSSLASTSERALSCQQHSFIFFKMLSNPSTTVRSGRYQRSGIGPGLLCEHVGVVLATGLTLGYRLASLLTIFFIECMRYPHSIRLLLTLSHRYLFFIRVTT